MDLMERYNCHKAYCRECGRFLTSAQPLGSVFVMDTNGDFYCSFCDDEFEDGDDRIFEPDLVEVDDESVTQCEFCGEYFPDDAVEPTSFCGCYCRGCLELMIDEARAAIEEINIRMCE